MTTQLRLRCACGSVRASERELSPARVVRGVCYRDDCQAFARFLGRAGLLDEHGGSDMVQMTWTKDLGSFRRADAMFRRA